MENNKIQKATTSQLKALTRSFVAKKFDPLSVSNLTTKQAFEEGTNIRTVMRSEPQKGRLLLLQGLAELITFMDAKKTISNDSEIQFSVDSMIEDFPSLTIEDFLIVFRNIKKGRYGKFYERLKLAEISDCIREYEATERADYLEIKANDFKSSEIPEAITDSEMYKNSRYNWKLEEEREKKKKYDSDKMAIVRAEFELNRAKEQEDFKKELEDEQKLKKEQEKKEIKHEN